MDAGMRRSALFLNYLGDRAIDPASLEKAVRRVVFTTYAVLVGFAIATGFQAYLRGAGNYMAQPGILLPKPSVWLAGGGLAISAVFILAGAAHAKSRWRYLALTPVPFLLFFILSAE